MIVLAVLMLGSPILLIAAFVCAGGKRRWDHEADAFVRTDPT